MNVSSKHPREVHAERWFTDHGYRFTLKRRMKTKTVYTVAENNREAEVAVPAKLSCTTASYLDMIHPAIRDRLR